MQLIEFQALGGGPFGYVWQRWVDDCGYSGEHGEPPFSEFDITNSLNAIDELSEGFMSIFMCDSNTGQLPSYVQVEGAGEPHPNLMGFRLMHSPAPEVAQVYRRVNGLARWERVYAR